MRDLLLSSRCHVDSPTTYWSDDPLVQKCVVGKKANGLKKCVIGPTAHSSEKVLFVGDPIGPKKRHWSENPIGPTIHLSEKVVIGPKTKLVRRPNWSEDQIGLKTKLVRRPNWSEDQIGPKTKLVRKIVLLVSRPHINLCRRLTNSVPPRSTKQSVTRLQNHKLGKAGHVDLLLTAGRRSSANAQPHSVADRKC